MPQEPTPRVVPQNGPAIREIRQREGLTISQLANAVGISDPHLRNIETENKPARPEHLSRIARRLDCNLQAIRRSNVAADDDMAVGA
jgi:XRE family transcriptional regulator, fatty acid utilization regulator